MQHYALDYVALDRRRRDRFAVIAALFIAVILAGAALLSLPPDSDSAGIQFNADQTQGVQ